MPHSVMSFMPLVEAEIDQLGMDAMPSKSLKFSTR